jgi:hypothetical protein
MVGVLAHERKQYPKGEDAGGGDESLLVSINTSFVIALCAAVVS